MSQDKTTPPECPSCNAILAQDWVKCGVCGHRNTLETDSFENRAMQIVNNVAEEFCDHGDTRFATPEELCRTIQWLRNNTVDKGWYKAMQEQGEHTDKLIESMGFAIELLGAKARAKELERERDEARSQLEIKKLGRDKFRRMKEDLAASREEARRLREALEKIEERHTDGEDTYADWKFMGDTARDALRTTEEVS